ncbi:MAG: SDR family oxidoreductase [Planctomycetales bacterium]
MPFPLRNRTAMVTGATSGIGRATAVALAQAGADGCLNHWGQAEETNLAAREIQDLGRRVLVHEADVSDLAAVEAMTQAVVDSWGRLDVAVSNAYFSEREPLHEANMETFHRTMDVTMCGALHLFRAASRQMIDQGQGGSLVAVGSPHAWIPFAGSMAYNMSKAATVQMAKTAALELAEHRIRVNVVHPGWTDTPGERKFLSDEEMRAAAAELPWGRMARPEEIARAVVFFCDPESDYLTGSELLVDGGITLPWRTENGKLD